MKRKRAPGAGRPIEEATAKSKAIPVRVTPKLWNQLHKASEENKRPLSEEIRGRLKKSLDESTRPDIGAATELISGVMRRIERATGKQWREDAFTSTAIRRGTEVLLFHIGAQGPTIVPPNIKKLAERLPHDYSTISQTPEELGSIEAGRLISEIEMEGLWDFEEAKSSIPKGGHVDHRRPRNVTLFRHLKRAPKRSSER